MPEKLEIIKFDPKARKHVAYKETKLKLPRARCMAPRRTAAARVPHMKRPLGSLFVTAGMPL